MLGTYCDNVFHNSFQLLFSNFTLTENMLENKKEMEKLLKFDNITNVFVVGKALRASNKGMVVKALQKSVDMQNIESNVSNFQILPLILQKSCKQQHVSVTSIPWGDDKKYPIRGAASGHPFFERCSLAKRICSQKGIR